MNMQFVEQLNKMAEEASLLDKELREAEKRLCADPTSENLAHLDEVRERWLESLKEHERLFNLVAKPTDSMTLQ